MTRRGAVRALAAAVAALCLAVPGAAAGQDPCAIETSARVVAIGDVHGALDQFVAILRAAGIVDDNTRWTAGDTVLVQTGDILDRGPDSRGALDLLQRLEREAAGAGGRLVALLGNHEVMRMVGDWRYVSDAEFAAFETPRSEAVREAVYRQLAAQFQQRADDLDEPFDEDAFRQQFLDQVPLGLIEMRDAFGPDGEYGRWLRQRPAVARVDDVLFVHGGLTPTLAAQGCEAINEQITREITGTPVTPEQLPSQLSSSETGPLWDRSLAGEPEADYAPVVAAMLSGLGARAIVVGHTPVVGEGIVTRFGGRAVLIDTGMLGGESFPGGEPSALEIVNGRFTAVYLDRREPVAVPDEVPEIPAAAAAPAAP